MSQKKDCHVYWGTHGCGLPRGHIEPHFCCCECGDRHPWVEPDVKCVGRFPYYGFKTKFYGQHSYGERRRFLLSLLIGRQR